MFIRFLELRLFLTNFDISKLMVLDCGEKGPMIDMRDAMLRPTRIPLFRERPERSGRPTHVVMIDW